MRRTPKLGQHFLTGTWAAKKLVEAARISSEDTVLEIGPGKGALTKEIAATGAHIVAVEKDEMLVSQLRGMFPSGQLTVIEGDIRDFDPSTHGLTDYILAANIPYYITGEIIRTFLTASQQPMRMALLIQKEVADRILARDKKESILSLSVKAYGIPSIAAKVSRGNFSPPPSVDSAILAIDEISKKFFDGVSEELFFKTVRAGFASKRKYLSSNLSVVFDRELVTNAFRELQLNEKIRAEDVTLAQWKLICELLGRSRVIS